MDERETVWGIQAHYTPKALMVVFYHVIMFVGPLIFFIVWLIRHPGDLQNASVPLVTTVAMAALIWSCFIYLAKG